MTIGEWVLTMNCDPLSTSCFIRHSIYICRDGERAASGSSKI